MASLTKTTEKKRGIKIAKRKKARAKKTKKKLTRLKAAGKML